MAQVLSQKEVQQLLDSFEKTEEKDAKIKRLGLSLEDKNKLDTIMKGIDEFERGPAEQMAQTFLGIKEVFKFSEERVKVIKNEMVHGFAEGQLEKLNFSVEQKIEILKIITDEEEMKEEMKKEENKIEELEKSPKQEFLLKAYEQLLGQKKYFLEILNGLKFDEKAVNDIIFFSDSVKEIFKILETDEKEKVFISINAADSIKVILKLKEEIIQNIETADDETFVNNFDRDMDLIMTLKEVWNSEVSKPRVDWLSEFNLLFSYFKEDNPEFIEKISEKLKTLLDHFGFEQICPVKKEEYNPREHLVDGEIKDSDVKRGQVVRVVRMGLKKGSEVIQKAKVVIGK